MCALTDNAFVRKDIAPCKSEKETTLVVRVLARLLATDMLVDGTSLAARSASPATHVQLIHLLSFPRPAQVYFQYNPCGMSECVPPAYHPTVPARIISAVVRALEGTSHYLLQLTRKINRDWKDCGYYTCCTHTHTHTHTHTRTYTFAHAHRSLTLAHARTSAPITRTCTHTRTRCMCIIVPTQTGAQWGHMHWYHVTSKDLIHWKDEPIAIKVASDRVGRNPSCLLSKSPIM